MHDGASRTAERGHDPRKSGALAGVQGHVLHRFQLPVISQCDAFVGREATDDAPGHCTHCAKDVHDLSRMTEDEVVALIARTGGDLCVSYRVREDGMIELRQRRPRLAPAVLTLALTGCAGHFGEPMDDAEDDEHIVARGLYDGCPMPDEPPMTPADKYAVDSTELDEALAAGHPDESITPGIAARPLWDDPSMPGRVTQSDPGATATGDEETASCVVTDRMRRMAEAERRFARGKLGPLTDSLICANERIREAEARRQRRQRRGR